MCNGTNENCDDHREQEMITHVNAQKNYWVKFVCHTTVVITPIQKEDVRDSVTVLLVLYLYKLLIQFGMQMQGK